HNGSSSNASEGWWRIALLRGKHGVRRFIGVETFEQYLEKRSPLTRMFSGKVPVQSGQNEELHNITAGASESSITISNQASWRESITAQLNEFLMLWKFV